MKHAILNSNFEEYWSKVLYKFSCKSKDCAVIGRSLIINYYELSDRHL